MVFSSCFAGTALAAEMPAAFGPFNVTALEGGIGIARSLPTGAPVAKAGLPWSITTWIRIQRTQPGRVVVVAIGDAMPGRSRLETWRGIVLSGGVPGLQLNGQVFLQADRALEPDTWSALTATYDGQSARLYVDGRERASALAATNDVTATLAIAPAVDEDFVGEAPHFGGSLAQLAIAAAASAAPAIAWHAMHPPDFSLVTFLRPGAGWPLQDHAWRGLQVPQDPWTLPTRRSVGSTDEAAVSPNSAAPMPPTRVASSAASADELRASEPGHWTVSQWRMAAVPAVMADGASVSDARFAAESWLPATVPGTVLTTLIANKVYPDPDYGLNNLQIPDSLSRQAH